MTAFSFCALGVTSFLSDHMITVHSKLYKVEKMGAVNTVRSVILTLILSNYLTSARKYHVPVLIWGSNYENIKENSFPSLARVASDQFFNHFMKNLHKVDEKSTIVLFAEETLSVEDFSVQDVKRDGSFPLVKNLVSKNKKEFLPSVENPVSVLTGPDVKSYGFTVSELNLNNVDAVNRADKQNTIYLVNLEDADTKEDRPHMLHRHDEKISKIFDELSKNNKNVVAILTGRYSSWTEPEEIMRFRRQANNESEPSTTVATHTNIAPGKSSGGNAAVLMSSNSFIYSKTFPILRTGSDKIVLENQTQHFSDNREKFLKESFVYSTTIGKVTLRFRFENTSDVFWSLPEVELELPSPNETKVLLKANRDISARHGYSYYTNSPVVFSGGSNSLTFSDMQIQPWYVSPSNDMKKFGLAEDDTQFFTAPIWSGLIVTSLLLVILMWGLSMILDIHTMDQFDDPKGKTITVNVTD